MNSVTCTVPAPAELCILPEGVPEIRDDLRETDPETLAQAYTPSPAMERFLREGSL